MRPTQNDFKLAQILLNHSLKIKPKEKVMITTSDIESTPLVKAVYIEALKLGAYPLVDTQFDFYINRNVSHGLSYQFYKHATTWQQGYVPDKLLKAMVEWTDAFVRIVSINNTKELARVPKDKITNRMKLVRPYFDTLINKDRWILTYYPTEGMAQAADMSYDELLDFYFEACIVDYAKMKKDLSKIEKILDEGSEIHIQGNKTDLKFSIKGRLAKAAYGQRNIPDGEVFIAPIHTSVEGHVYFDLPSIYSGSEMNGIYMEFKQGKVIRASAEQGQEEVDSILSTDKGARYLGELGIGTNFQIQRAMKNTLFDEKIGGTIHLALGRSYEEQRGGAPTDGNVSAIHWDIVKDMKSPGSVVSVDGKPLLREGAFVV